MKCLLLPLMVVTTTAMEQNVERMLGLDEMFTKVCQGLTQEECVDDCQFLEGTCQFRPCDVLDKDTCRKRKFAKFRCAWDRREKSCMDKPCKNLRNMPYCNARDDCVQTQPSRCADKDPNACEDISGRNNCNSKSHCTYNDDQGKCLYSACEDWNVDVCKTSFGISRCSVKRQSCISKKCKQLKLTEMCEEREDCVVVGNKCKDKPETEAPSEPEPEPPTQPDEPIEEPRQPEQGDFKLKVEMIDLNKSGLTSTQKEQVRLAFANAAKKWRSVIVKSPGFIPQEPERYESRSCFDMFSVSQLKETIEDLSIGAVIEPIDGRNGILGSAGPCLGNRASSGKFFPRIGGMRFDSDDVAHLLSRNLFEGVILHEMGHVIGIGTLWSSPGLGNDLVRYSSITRSYFWNSGENAIEQNTKIYNSKTDVLPVIESDGGGGTAGGHWDEKEYENELMTGYVSNGMALSKLTIGALEDLGYSVDYSQADPYVAPAARLNRVKPSPTTKLVETAPLGDMVIVDDDNNEIDRVRL